MVEYVSPDDQSPLSAEDGRDVSGALLHLVTVGERIAFECLDSAPSSGSPASKMFSGESDGTNLVMEAFLLMQYASLSGFDHVRAFTTLCRSSPRATALATLTRGALEAFARTRFLSQAIDERDLRLRLVSLQYADLRFPVNLGERIFTRDGDRVDVPAKRAYYLAEVGRLGFTRPLRADAGELVASMLDAEIGDGMGLRYYSLLSSVAHAHRSGINVFVVTDGETGGVSGMRASVDVVGALAMQVMAGMVAATEGFVDLFGRAPRHVDLLGEATRRTTIGLNQFVQRHRGS